MPSPAPGTIIRHELGQAYVELDLMQSMMGYIGQYVLPYLSVGLQSGQFPKVKLKSLLRKVTLADLRRAAGGTYKQDTWEYEADNYSTEEYGKEEPIDQRLERIAVAGGVPVDQLASDRSIWFNMHALEQAIADEVTNTTTYATQLTPVTTTVWTDHENATPIDDVLEAAEAYEERNAMPPRILAMSLKAARHCLLCDQVASKLSFRPSEALRGEHLPSVWLTDFLATVLAQVLGVPRVLIGDGFGNSANAGLSPTPTRIWPADKVALLDASQSPDVRMPGFGRVFNWTGDTGGQPVAVEEYWSDEKRSRVIRARQDIHMKVIHSSLLQIITGVA